MQQLHINTFKGLQNLPIYVARKQNFFAQRGLNVEISYTTGSIPQLAGLVREEYQLIQTAPDNIINVDTNPAAFELDSAIAPHMIMLLGGSVGPLSIYSQTGINTFDSLRGTVLGVDNPTSGFALVLRDILARNGLLLGHDYTFTVAGGTSNRLEALKKGSIAATILYLPFDEQAIEAGLHKLATSTNYYPVYASLSTAGIKSWIEQHTDQVTGYISAYLQALRWIYDPAHALDVQAIMQNEPFLGLNTSIASYAYSAFVDPKTGFDIHALLDDAGLEQVIELRTIYVSSPVIGRDLSHYRDLRWYPR